MRTPRRTVALFVGVVASAALVGPWAQSALAGYSAEFVGQCCYETMEAGDVLTDQYFLFKNNGDQYWYASGLSSNPVTLGTAQGHDRASPFQPATGWYSGGRLVSATKDVIAPGETGKFAFTIRAPQQPGDYQEHFALVAEFVRWMDEADVYLDWNVLAAQAPALKITAAPARVKRGDPVNVSVDATDNLAVKRVSFAVGTQTVTRSAATTGKSGYDASLDSSGLGAGTQTVVVRAVDPGGRESVATADFELYEPPPADRDGDGVPDPVDKCPDVPALGRDANGDGCVDPPPALDSDHDGVADSVDKCSTTPAGPSDANHDGCTDPVMTHAFQVSPAASRGRLVSLVVLSAAPRAKITVICRSKCKRRNKVIARGRMSKKGKATTIGVRRAHLHAGAVIEVRITQGKRVLGRYAKFKILKSIPWAHRVQEGCVTAEGRHSAC